MKKNFRLVSQILRGMWLIEARYAEGYLPIIQKLLSGEAQDADLQADEEEKPACYAIGMSASGSLVRFDSFDQAEPGSVAVIPIKGAIMKEDYCGSPGTQTMKAWHRQAEAHPNIVGHVLDMSTGGGAVDGTFELRDELKSSKKPIVTYGDGMIASAGYALASATAHIMMSHKTAEIGSIGTAISFRDASAYYEQMGIKTHYIRASESFQKNEDFLQALKENYKPLQQNILNPTNEIFLDAVREGRKGKLMEADPIKGKTAGEPLNGQMYLAEKAIELGLADSIGTLEDAIALAQQMAKTPIPGKGQQSSQSKHSLNQNYTSMHKIKVAYTALLGFFGLKATEGSEYVETQISDEMLQNLNSELARLQSENATLITDKSNLQTEVDKVKADLTTAQTSLSVSVKEAADWKTKAETYGAQPGQKPTAAVKNQEVIESTADADPNQVIANLEHNKVLEGNPLFNFGS